MASTVQKIYIYSMAGRSYMLYLHWWLYSTVLLCFKCGFCSKTSRAGKSLHNRVTATSKLCIFICLVWIHAFCEQWKCDETHKTLHTGSSHGMLWSKVWCLCWMVATRSRRYGNRTNVSFGHHVTLKHFRRPLHAEGDVLQLYSY